jgi:glucokinase
VNKIKGSEKMLVGLELTTRLIKGICIDESGKIIGRESIAVLADIPVDKQLADLVKRLKEKFGSFQRVGLALPGLIDRKKNRLALSRRLPDAGKLDFVKTLKNIADVDLILENDGNAGALGEFTFGAGKGAESMLYIGLGEGVAGAFVFHGKLWRGASGFAGEVGHIMVDAEQGLSLENVASAKNILRRIKKRFHQDHTSSLAKIKEDDLTISDVVNGAIDEDDFAQMMLERTGLFLGNALAVVINLLDVEKIVVCGEVMSADGFVLNGIQESLKKLCYETSLEAVEIVAGELGEDSVAIGAALVSAG